MEIAELVVKRMNEAVLDSEFHDKCAQLTVDKKETLKSTLKEFSPRNGKKLYRVELRVSPSGGYYEALAVVSYRVYKYYYLMRASGRKWKVIIGVAKVS